MKLTPIKIATMSLFFILYAFPQISFAADIQQDNTLDDIIQIYQAATQTWEPIIHNLTLGLFWGLVSISFTWSSMRIALTGGGLVDVLADLTTRVLTVGVAVYLINEAPNLARYLISSFHEIGSRLSGGDVSFSPSNIVELAINVISNVWEKASVWKPIQTLMMFITALIILVCFALIAMDMTILITSSYIIVSGGIVMMGFLGSEWTKENALNYFTAVLGVATRMFVMQLILILGYGFIHDLMTNMSQESPDTAYLTLLIVSIVFYGLIHEIPQIAATLASGRFTLAGNGMTAAIGAAAGVVAGAALAATGVATAGYSAGTSALNPTETADNEAATLKRSLDTGGYSPPLNASGSGGNSGGGTETHTSSSSSPDISPSASSESPSDTSAQSSNFQSLLDSKFGGGNADSAGETTESTDSVPDEQEAPTVGEGNKSTATPTAPTSSKASQIMKATGAASVAVAKSVAVSTLSSVARKSALGNAMARAGIDLMADSKDTHQALMNNLNKNPGRARAPKETSSKSPPSSDLTKDDGNDPNNYRDTLEELDERDDKRNT